MKTIRDSRSVIRSALIGVLALIVMLSLYQIYKQNPSMVVRVMGGTLFQRTTHYSSNLNPRLPASPQSI